MKTRSLAAVGTLLVAILGCGDEDEPPTGPATPPTHAAAATALTFSQLGGGGDHTCGLTTDDRAYCWGWNYTGQIGDGSTVYSRAVPTAVAGTLRFRQVSAGANHTCAVATDYRAYCWGDNFKGQLGDGTKIERRKPAQVAGSLSFLRVDAGDHHTCGITTTNKAYCWGGNESGQLGDGTTTERTVPRAVVGTLLFRLVAAGGYNHTCGVTTDNRAFCWGSDQYGQLGDSATGWKRLKPSHVAGAFQWRQLEAGNSHTCGVTTSNSAYCWGQNQYGQLGIGTTVERRLPRPVLGAHAFRRVTAGLVHTCGEATSDKVYCWGGNFAGQLGDGTDTDRLTPVAVIGGLSFSQASAGGSHTCGKTASGTAYCWGFNRVSQLGDGSTNTRLAPTQVAGVM